MARSLLVVLGAALLAGGVLCLQAGQFPAAAMLCLWGALLIVGTLYERFRYKPLEAAPLGRGWTRTTERFIDGETVELNSSDHPHLMTKIEGNPHFEVEMGEEEPDENKPRRGRPPLLPTRGSAACGSATGWWAGADPACGTRPRTAIEEAAPRSP